MELFEKISKARKEARIAGRSYVKFDFNTVAEIGAALLGVKITPEKTNEVVHNVTIPTPSIAD